MENQPSDGVRRFGVAYSENRESAQLAAVRARAILEGLGAQVFSLEQVLEGVEAVPVEWP